ncbi:acetate kinase [Leptolyngbya cf. ectocarpi LEGE 11479]|uniref:Acetate kinase n=1 Tax=Leptolyngbya cf. ectocarpi LEGE 11479 TaxID=1828722 RepID=A0A929F6F2_LEPEC|nr:acetate kinase [Leptolyngbya ectocarpi]MBE9068150.1 acetate kinase [Leptolyngbya cf. ectocarpi LEGE 11479]
MKILVLNAGSSSHKLCLYAWGDAFLPKSAPAPVWQAQIDWYSDRVTVEVSPKAASPGAPLKENKDFTSRRQILSEVLSTLWQGTNPVLHRPDEIDAVGHRVVHGGQTYQTSTLVTPDVKTEISRLRSLAPNHNPANLEGIELMEELLGDTPQIAVFDTAFHRQMPDVAAIYPGPYEWVNQGIRRYGFHGISHQYCSQRAAQLLKRDDLRLIICHLGNGGSLTAVHHGQSIDTTMGFTPLDGLMMGTRSGAIDPGILIYLMRQGYSADQLDQVLNKESGLKGISGISHDLRHIKEAITAGDVRAQLALDIYLHRLKSCVGSMLMGLGGLDVIVFTAGIGEHAASIRTETCKAMAFLGLKLDLVKNEQNPVDQDVAMTDSAVRVLVIHTQEDWAIAQDCWSCIQQMRDSA